MPGWAIALMVFAVVVFVVLPVLAVVGVITLGVRHGQAVRAEVAQGIAFTGRARMLVAEYIVQRGALPRDNAALGLPAPASLHTPYVRGVWVSEGKVMVLYGNGADAAIHGGTVVLAPVGSAVQLRWRCSSPNIRADYLPEGCRY